jgi:RNA polymerase sigma factor (TIGR02999 family)
MRQVLIDHARRRNSEKRGGDRRREELDDLSDHIAAISRLDVLALHEGLDALAKVDPRKAAVLEMRYFGGYTMGEIPGALDNSSRPVSLSTVERDFRFGLAWLLDYLSPEGAQ